jgi:hypothetical protein
MDKVACGTARSLSLEMSFPVSHPLTLQAAQSVIKAFDLVIRIFGHILKLLEVKLELLPGHNKLLVNELVKLLKFFIAVS